MNPILPRVCYLALTLAQPFLVESATTFMSKDVSSNDPTIGGGIIAGYGCVYIGLAVRTLEQNDNASLNQEDLSCNR